MEPKGFDVAVGPNVHGNPAAVMKQKRKEGLQKIYIISICMIILSSGGLPAGICTYIFAAENLIWPLSWGGVTIPSIILLTSGILGTLAARECLKGDNVSPKSHLKLLWHYRLNGISISFCCLSLGYSAWTLAICLAEWDEKKDAKRNGCLPNREPNTEIAITNLVFAFFMVIVSITSVAFGCRFGKAISCGCEKTVPVAVPTMTQYPSSMGQPPQYPGTTQQYYGPGGSQDLPPSYNQQQGLPAYNTVEKDYTNFQTKY